jgi:uncharacterized protein YyaL (SSP411 family)
MNLMSRICSLLLGLLACVPAPSSVARAQERPDSSTEKQSAKSPTPPHTNRLAKESSPYLLQHAHNPVDWYPWGDEAIEKARREGKMIFLSVGYAACHWCHVMERESFEDPEIAKIMNERFVCVKVDREERPDVDQIYMTAVQLVSGRGGWPMSVFLLPDTQPFWGGTYFPARDGDRGQSSGFLTVIKQIDAAWKTQRKAVENQATALTSAIRANQQASADRTQETIELSAGLVQRVASALADQFDPQYGGFGYSPADPNRPKFPEPSNLVFLSDRMNRDSVPQSERDRAKAMLLESLDGMIRGAMLDHLGGGFHRYSVDRRWQIPHFEKMLYDNGQLASVYAAAYRDTQRDEYRFVVEGICDFVLRELKAPGGGFYSALDADSDGEEGKFYRWTDDEIVTLSKNVAGFSLASEVYRLSGKPNFEGEYHVPDPGMALTVVAEKRKQSFAELNEQLQPLRAAMFEARRQHARPITDVKILTAWNGLMIAGLADAGRLLDRPDYTEAAATAAEFVLGQLRQQDGRLLRSYAADQAKLNAYVDDYAFLTSGLIALHRATNQPRWLNLACEVTDQQISRFWDDTGGGFFFTSKDHPALIVRVKDPADGAVPSGTAVSLENLQYLAQSTGSDDYDARFRQTLQSIAPLLNRVPSAAARSAAMLAAWLDRPSQ